MATVSDSLVSATARRLTVRRRPDLIVRRQFFQGQTSYAVKEPLGPGYFRFKEEDFAVLEMLDGKSSLDEIKRRFEARYPHLDITAERLWQFVAALHRGNLLVSGAPDQGTQLKKRRDERKRKELLSKLANVLAIRFRGFDPQWLLDWLYPKVRWCFSPVAVFLSCLVAVSALLLITVQFDVFVSRLPAFHQFFGLKNAGWLVLALVISKVLHEFGHGLSCKHFGGECHEIGILILVLTPCLYCNVSDSWMLPNKWHRAAIGAAGMYVEIVLASICTFIWWFSEPGFLHYVCLYIMFICSVSTILFNANPLLRFDGYYILSDLVEIPNLRQKSTAVLQRTIGWWCMGLEPPRDRYLPPRRRVFFVFYSIAAAVYRWFIVFFILWFLTKVFEPYRLEIIGQLIATAALIGLVVVPCFKLGKFLWVPGRWEQVKKKRLIVSLCVVAALLLAVLCIPLPYSVLCPAEVQVHGAASVYVEVPGTLRTVNVRWGEHVEAGEELAHLENVDLQLDIAKLIHKRNQLALELKTLGRQRFHDRQALSEVPPVQESLQSVEEQLGKRVADRDALVLKAPRAGWILRPPARPEEPRHEATLPGWSGTPLDPQNVGCFLESKTLFCDIGDPRRLEVVLVVDQSQLDFVDVGAAVELKLDELPEDVFTGTVQSIAEMEMQVTPASLSAKAGGELATKTDEAGVEKPQSTSYQAQVLLEDREGLLRLGLRGRAKVHAAKRTLGQRIYRYFSHTFRFGM